MEKNEEIRILRETVNKLGRNSYTGDWLAGLIPEIEGLMRADICPTITINEAKQQAAAIIDEARGKAADIEAKAKIEADTIIKGAEQKRDRIFTQVWDSLKVAEKELSTM